MAKIIFGIKQYQAIFVDGNIPNDKIEASLVCLGKSLNSFVSYRFVDKQEFFVVLNDEEVKVWLKSYKKRKHVANILNTLAGHLGGHGVDLVDERGRDLSMREELNGAHVFSYGG